jgi:imidazolonepropionase-like amidohydrolase
MTTITHQQKKLFTHITLINGSNPKPIKDACLLVSDHRIEFAGKRDELETIPPGCETIDCQGQYMIPGLIDCHIHLDLHGFADTFQENLVEDKFRTLRAATEMENTLKAGFTTVRSVGSVNGIDFAVKAGIDQGLVQGPRILAAGKIISMTCSGTEYFDGMYALADGKEACKKAAREQLRDGADMLKVMATGAVMNPGGVPGAPQLDEDEIRAVVEEGNKLGCHTAAHAHGAQGIINAVRAGVRTIEHGTMADEAALEIMAKAGTFLVPTMSLHDRFEAHADEIPPFMLEKGRQMQEAYFGIIKKAAAMGIPIAMGTDAGTNYNFHGINAAEIVYFVKNDILTPELALASATRVAAQAIQMDHEVGTLESGKWADFVLLDKNPLEDIRALADPKAILAVYKDGEKI